jgi:hypothetical protein
MASVVKWLREAEVAYQDNRHRDAVTAVRRAFDGFMALISVPGAKEIDSIAREQRDERQRWGAVYHALMGVLHAGPHADASPTRSSLIDATRKQRSPLPCH